MSGFHVLEYSLPALKDFFISETKTPPQNLINKIHLIYFEEYFRELKAQTIIIEYQYIDHDYLEDFAAYYVKCFRSYNRFCTRLHFFDIPFSTEDFSDVLVSKSQHITRDILNKSYLGFIVVKPIPVTFIGRSCLKTYSEIEGRNYPFHHKYSVNLFGLRLEVDSLAYQEQDSVVAACASTAIWTAFQATAFLFQHSVPTPVEITKAAVRYFPYSNRHFPNEGLSAEQMAQAIRNVGLEPYLIDASDSDIIKASVYAYQKAGIPLVMGLDLIEGPATNKRYIGKHAVTITGYRLDGDKVSFPSSSFHLMSSRITKIYAHDDQVGPFARMGFIHNESNLTTSWQDNTGRTGNVFAIPEILLIPLYNKLRIPFKLILREISKLDELLDIIDANLHLGISEIEWEIFLANSNQLKEEIFSSDLNRIEKLNILTKNLPKYVWRAIAHLNEEKIEFIFDTTDIEQGEIFLGLIKHSEGIVRMFKTISDNIVLEGIKSLQLQSIFRSIRE